MNKNDALGGDSPLSESDREDIGKVGEADFEETKRKILKPYVEWIGDRDRVTQFLVVFVCIPLSLGFFISNLYVSR